MIKTRGTRARSNRGGFGRAGVSWIALLAAGAGGPAWAATQPAPQAQDTQQAPASESKAKTGTDTQQMHQSGK